MSTIEKIESGLFGGKCEDCGYPVEATTRPDAREFLESHRQTTHLEENNDV